MLAAVFVEKFVVRHLQMRAVSIEGRYLVDFSDVFPTCAGVDVGEAGVQDAVKFAVVALGNAPAAISPHLPREQDAVVIYEALSVKQYRTRRG